MRKITSDVDAYLQGLGASAVRARLAASPGPGREAIMPGIVLPGGGAILRGQAEDWLATHDREQARREEQRHRQILILAI